MESEGGGGDGGVEGDREGERQEQRRARGLREAPGWRRRGVSRASLLRCQGPGAASEQAAGEREAEDAEGELVLEVSPRNDGRLRAEKREAARRRQGTAPTRNA